MKNLRKIVLSLLLVALFLPLSNAHSLITDDFNTHSGLWDYSGSAYRDSGSGLVVLTVNDVNNQVGQIWLKTGYSGSFTARFKYWAGGSTTSVGADGLIFMFNTDRSYVPKDGGTLGFNVPAGYGVEFDNWYNGWGDPSGRHIAIMRNSYMFHLASVDSDKTEDETWHNVEIMVGAANVTVSVDGVFTVAKAMPIDQTFNGLGFSSATGSANNWHLIDDFEITIDGDGDGIPDSEDNCPGTDNAGQADSDSDGVGDACDPCPDDPDNDIDGDGVCGDVDNCPNDPNDNQADNDEDGAGDVCDDDDDNDGVTDDIDNCQFDANDDQADFDDDGAGDVCDDDDDDDGLGDDVDQCPNTPQGEVVDEAGCAIVDYCPCDNNWKNHGGYVSCVAKKSEAFLNDGLITEEEKDATVSEAAQSPCGAKVK
jgi:hypothetical protein